MFVVAAFGAVPLVAAIFGDITALVPGGNLVLLPGNRVVVVVVVVEVVVVAAAAVVAVAIFASGDCRESYMDCSKNCIGRLQLNSWLNVYINQRVRGDNHF